MAKRVWIGGLVVFALVAAIVWVPWFTEKRTVIAATPVTPPLFGVTPVPLGPGKAACLDELTLAPEMEIGQIGVRTDAGPGPALEVTVEGDGYRDTTRIPGGYEPTQALQFRLEPPAAALIGRLCVRNAGDRPVELIGTNEFRTMGRPTMTADGQSQPFDFQLQFFERERESFAGRIGDIFGHAAVFTPGVVPAALIGMLALLALIGIPVGILSALARAARDDEQDD